MSTTSTDSATRSVVPNLKHAFGGVWRLTRSRFRMPGYWLTLIVGTAVLALLYFGSLRNASAHHFIDWTIGVYLTFLVPAIAFMTGAGVMRDEMKSCTVDYVLTRPIPRPAFILFKYAAHTFCTQIDFLVAFAVVLSFAVVHEVPGLTTVAFTFLFGQVMLIAAFSAFGFLCGVLSSRYYVIGLVYGLIIEVGVGQIPTQLSRLSMTHQMRILLKDMLHQTEAISSGATLFGTTSMLILFCTITLGAAAVLFTFREFSGNVES